MLLHENLGLLSLINKRDMKLALIGINIRLSEAFQTNEIEDLKHFFLFCNTAKILLK